MRLPRADDLAPRPPLSSRRLVSTLVVLVSLVAAVATVCQWPLWNRNPTLAALNTLVSLAFTAVGVFLHGQGRRHDPQTWGFFLAGVFWPTIWVDGWGGAGWLRLSQHGSSLSWWTVASAILLYPYGRLGSYERAWIVCAFLLLPGLEFLLDLTSTTYAQVPFLLNTSNTALVVGFLFLVIRRWMLTTGMERRVLLPVLSSAAVTAVVAGIGSPIMVTGTTRQADAFLTVQSLTLLAVPMAFLAGTLHRRLAQAGVADELARLPWPASVEAVQEALRRALQDEQLEVRYWLVESGGYVDAHGRFPRQPEQPGRLAVPVYTHDDEPLAVLLVDPQLAEHQELLNAATAAGALALLNARLQAGLRAQQDQLRAAQQRVEEARWAERRELERNLHDGAQHRLAAVTLWLGLTSVQAAKDPSLKEAIDRAQDEVRAVLQELRDIAHGIHPALLTHAGLGPALEALAERQPLPVHVVAPKVRFPPVAEAIAYYVAAEALVNVLKHANATCATVRVQPHDSDLRLEVVDDGVGGADPTRGSGLVGLQHRVGAVGGELHIATAPGAGTRITARVPCG